MTTTYALSGNSIVKRIRSPHPHDVLSGRGGGINSHVGNKTFRDWVRERKEAYNLAPTKADKAVVANEVVALVKALDPPGRFLQRDPNSSSNSSSWIEVDDTRALAKTSQALREGAPQIRAAHKDELETRARKPKRKKIAQAASANPASTQARPTKHQTLNTNTLSTIYTQPISMSTRKPTGPAGASESESGSQRMQPVSSGPSIVAPLMSNSQFDEAYGRSAKRGRVDESESEPFFSASAETPPLTSVPPPRISIPPLRASFEAAVKMADGGNSNYSRLKRSHSLALSEISAGDVSGGDEDFVNPFADESELLLGSCFSKPNTPGGLKNVSSIARGEHEEGGLSSANGLRSRGSIGSWSTKSITELSDLPDYSYQSSYQGSEFGEGMKLVYDAVHPDLTSPEKDDWIPTHLAPWRGGSFLRRPKALSPRSSSSSRRLNGRQ